MKINLNTALSSESASSSNVSKTVGHLLLGDPKAFGLALGGLEKSKLNFIQASLAEGLVSEQRLIEKFFYMFTQVDFWKAFYSSTKGNMSYVVDLSDYQDYIARNQIKFHSMFLKGASPSAITSYGFSILSDEDPILNTVYGFKGNINSFFSKYSKDMNFSKYSDDEAVISLLEDHSSSLGLTDKGIKAILAGISSRTIKQNQDSIDSLLD